MLAVVLEHLHRLKKKYSHQIFPPKFGEKIWFPPDSNTNTRKGNHNKKHLLIQINNKQPQQRNKILPKILLSYKTMYNLK